MAEEFMQEEEMEEKVPFSTRLKNLFFGDSEVHEEDMKYKRKMFDGRIERYLDENFNNYLEEFGLVTNVDTMVYEERYEELEKRTQVMKEYFISLDAEVSALERRVIMIKKKAAAKGRKK